MDNRKGQQFYIENPSYKGENFADKWNTHPERATAFFKWLDTARKDLVDGRLLQYNKIEMGNHLKECFGSETGKAVFNSEAETVRSAIAGDFYGTDSAFYIPSGIVSGACRLRKPSAPRSPETSARRRKCP